MAVSSKMLELGTKLPTFELRDAEGKAWVSTDVANGHPLLVAFWCNHCPYVIHLKQAFTDMARRYKERGLSVLAINANDAVQKPADGPEGMLADAREYDYCFPYVIDADQSVAKAFRAMCTPDFYLFDSQGLLVYRGRYDASTPRNDIPISGADLEGAIKALLSGAEISPEQYPSMGCSIKWKEGNAPDYMG